MPATRPAHSPSALVAVAALALAPCVTFATPLAGQAIAPGAADAVAALDASPRHGEWVTIPSGTDSVRSWVVYPERRDAAPVVVVLQEIYGLTHWIRAVADRLAADGFIAVAPDLLTMSDVPVTADGEPERQAAVAAVRALDADVVHRHIRAVVEYAMGLPSARASYGVVGFCWGGAVAFAHAVRHSDLGAAVVYYGTSPEAEDLTGVRVPVLGLYGEDDARVNATIGRAEEALGPALYRAEIFDGAGHGFLRQQDGRDGANLHASRWAWPFMAGFLRSHLEP